MFKRIKFAIVIFFISLTTFSQEGIPVYSDYLSDNYYLIFPSMAGASNCSKLRLTARKQWFDQENAPALQTLSYNGRVGGQSGVGAIIFNDVNGYHSQFGFKATYAHHIMFSRDNVELNQLSLGINVGANQSQLDQTDFQGAGDPVIGNDIDNATYFNVDIGASYNIYDFSINAVVKNVLETRQTLYSKHENDNLRKFIVSGGYVFGNADKILLEPSLLYQFVDKTRESALDMNLKAYKNLNNGQIWGGLSYRKSLDDVAKGIGTKSQKLQYVTPILGFNYKSVMLAYTYTHLLGDIQYSSSGFHQLTLGFNFLCKPVKYECNCPAVN